MVTAGGKRRYWSLDTRHLSRELIERWDRKETWHHNFPGAGVCDGSYSVFSRTKSRGEKFYIIKLVLEELVIGAI